MEVTTKQQLSREILATIFFSSLFPLVLILLGCVMYLCWIAFSNLYFYSLII